jgi:5-bromo-4-chloroindolyl phosphate hydrolysis protein
MNDILRQGRAWMPVLKSAALFVLPMPLLLASAVALFRGDLGAFFLIGGGLAALWGAGAIVWRALVAEAHYFLGRRLDPPALPLKLLSAALTALGTGLAAAAGATGFLTPLVLAALACAGHVAFYGRDLKRPRFELPTVTGVDRDAVLTQLKQAYGRLQGIEAAARNIAVPEFGDRLSRIIDVGRRILAEIERDPRDAARARRFLNVYLDSAERVTSEYARTHRQLRNRPLEGNFRQLLVDMEKTFEDQHRKLIENDMLSLDVEIEVLNARLKREGVN